MVINAAFETQKSQKNWFHVKSEWQKENKKFILWVSNPDRQIKRPTVYQWAKFTQVEHCQKQIII